jgi:hypothetical protein
MRIDGCTALITGASAGIGREFARQLGGRVAALVLVARRKARLEELRAELIERHPALRVEIRPTDLSQHEPVDELIAWAGSQKAAIDLLINNAGLGDMGAFSTADPERVDQMMQVNMVALTRLTRALLPAMIKQKRGAILMAVAFALTIAPWIIRNSLLHHKLTGVETSMGYNLYLGYHPQGNGSFVFGPSLDLLPILDDAERDKIGTQQAIEFIKAQPERFLPLAVNRLGFFFGLEKRVLMYFYGNDIIGFIPLPWLLTISAILLLPFVFVSVLATLGLSLLRWKPEHILLGLLLISYILPHVFILSEDRFHLALIPYIAILAAQVWVNGFAPLLVHWHESWMGKIAVVLAFCIVYLLFTNWGLELVRDADKIAQLLGPTGNQSYFPY